MLTTRVRFFPSHLCSLSHTHYILVMNLSHVITDFSFGPHFPEMSQPLKNTFELTRERKLVPYFSYLNPFLYVTLQHSSPTNTSSPLCRQPTLPLTPRRFKQINTALRTTPVRFRMRMALRAFSSRLTLNRLT